MKAVVLGNSRASGATSGRVSQKAAAPRMRAARRARKTRRRGEGGASSGVVGNEKIVRRQAET